jgi:hypothetical protein
MFVFSESTTLSQGRLSFTFLSQARLERVQEEVEACTVRNSKIDAAWAVLQKAVVAQDLHLDIQMQQKYILFSQGLHK